MTCKLSSKLFRMQATVGCARKVFVNDWRKLLINCNKCNKVPLSLDSSRPLLDDSLHIFVHAEEVGEWKTGVSGKNLNNRHGYDCGVGSRCSVRCLCLP